MVAFRAEGPQTNASRCAIHHWFIPDKSEDFD